MIEPISITLMDIAKLELSHDNKSCSIKISLSPKDNESSIPPAILGIMCASYSLSSNESTQDKEVESIENTHKFENIFSLESEDNKNNDSAIKILVSLLKDKRLFQNTDTSESDSKLAECIGKSIERFVAKIKSPMLQSQATTFIHTLFTKTSVKTDEKDNAQAQSNGLSI